MQLELMHESINDALAAIVAGLGGPKAVGREMRPELPIEQAAGWVRDRMNSTRREIFSPEQVVWLLKRARQAGIHSGFAFLAGECGYRAEPVEPQDEQAELMRAFVDAQKNMQKLAARLERVGLVRSAA